MRYRKKPVVIEAIRNDGEWEPIIGCLDGSAGSRSVITRDDDGSLNIETLEGTMRADVGDYVICGVKGELYPCKPDIFDATYEPAEEAS